MKKLLTSLLIFSTVLTFDIKASDELKALQETAVDLTSLQALADQSPNSPLQGYLSNIKLYNEKRSLEQRAEDLSMTLWGNKGTEEDGLLSNLPVDPFKRKEVLVQRINAAKEWWIKRLEFFVAESNLKKVATETNLTSLKQPKLLKE